MREYFDSPHIFGQKFVQYFYDDNMTEIELITEKQFRTKYHRYTLLGAVPVSSDINKQSQALDMTGNFILSAARSEKK